VSKLLLQITALSSKWYKRLMDMVEEYYGKKAAKAIFTIGETRWNSTQACFAFMLLIQSA
jgi:hypothetical protein